MAKKENKGGLLTPEHIEKDNAAKGKNPEGGHYHGSQDTGDTKVRQLGSQVQQNDGITDEPEEQA